MNTSNEQPEKFNPDEMLLYNLNFMNQFELDVQKFLITLSTGAIILTVSLLRLFSLTVIKILSSILIFSWQNFTASIMSGILSLIIKKKGFERNFLTDRSIKEKYKAESFKNSTRRLNRLGEFFWYIQVITFFTAVISLVIFATKSVDIY